MNTFIRTGRLALIAAMACLLMLAGCAKKTADEMLQEGDQLLGQKNLLEAEIKYEDVLDRYPDNETAYGHAHMGLAMVYGAQRNYQREREEYNTLIKKVGGPATQQGWAIYCQKLQSYINEGKPAEALRETLETSGTFKSAPAEAKYAYQGTLANLYLSNNETTKALEIFNTLSVDGVNDPGAQYDILVQRSSVYMRDKAWPKVIEADEAYLKRFPKSPMKSKVLFHLGTTYEQLKDKAKAGEAFDQAVAAAKEAFDKAVSADEKCDNLVQLAGIYQYRQDLAMAEKYMDQVIKEYPLSQLRITAMFGKAQIAMERKDPKAALAILGEINRLYPNSQASLAAEKRAREIQAELHATTGTLTRARVGATTGTAAAETAPTTGTTGAETAPTTGTTGSAR
ncbi:tetratricopeptide repeat protein [bacterium]|nr:tetratricopeptide repeat protein [bacterium]